MLDPSYVGKAMFGCEAVYVQGLLVLVLADTEEPWNGILVPTEKIRHQSLIAEFPDLVAHPILPKWLYLSAELDVFESVAKRLVQRIALADDRFGVLPKRRKRSRKKGRNTGRKSKN